MGVSRVGTPSVAARASEGDSVVVDSMAVVADSMAVVDFMEAAVEGNSSLANSWATTCLGSQSCTV
jgi:hypothetical protein